MPEKNTGRKALLAFGMWALCHIAGMAQQPETPAGRWLNAPFRPALSRYAFLQHSALPATALPPDLRACTWQADALPLFCKIEYHFEIRKKVPFKFRLGSVDYVDWLEGKPGYPAWMYR